MDWTSWTKVQLLRFAAGLTSIYSAQKKDALCRCAARGAVEQKHTDTKQVLIDLAAEAEKAACNAPHPGLEKEWLEIARVYRELAAKLMNGSAAKF